MARQGKTFNPATHAEWFSRQDFLRLFGRDGGYFDRDIRPKFPSDAIVKYRGRVWFHGRRCLDAWVAFRVSKEAPLPSDPDPLLNGPASPALEKYRRVRAEREAFLLQRDRGEWVPLDHVVSMHNELAAVQRDAVHRLRLRYGEDAAAIIIEATESYAMTLRNHLSSISPDHSASSAKVCRNGSPDATDLTCGPSKM